MAHGTNRESGALPIGVVIMQMFDLGTKAQPAGA
jgi:hypothetical protein